MSVDIIRAWKDEEYRLSLTDEQRAALPANPAGQIELAEADLEEFAGGLNKGGGNNQNQGGQGGQSQSHSNSQSNSNSAGSNSASSAGSAGSRAGTSAGTSRSGSR